MTLGERLRALRAKQGWDQETLAERLGVSRQAVSKWELDKTVPEVKYILAMSGLFDVTTDYLLTGDAPPADEEPVSPPPPRAAAPLPDILTDRKTGLPVWHSRFAACRAVVLGNVLAAVLTGIYLGFYCFGFSEPGLWPLVLTIVELPVLAALGALLLEDRDVPEPVRRRFRRDAGCAAALLAFALALLWGFREVIDDLLIDRYMGPGGMALGVALTAAILLGGYLAGWLLVGKAVPTP